MKAVLILMDSLNRHFLPAYGNDWVKTPNIDRLQERAVTFDNHWLGSAPCMPARRDMLTGRLNFLERGWGGIEPFDKPFTGKLRENEIYTHLETDHYHYFHVGGENYHTCFDTWKFYRGQEGDVYGSQIKKLKEPEHLGQWREQYAKNKDKFNTDADYPTPKTFAGAVDWLQENEEADDYFLWVEAFDPHEPFDCPEEFLKMYDENWEGPLYNWSEYDYIDDHDQKAIKHLRKRYAATLTMADKWLGKLLDEIERQYGFEDTMIILTTDHGHMLGEHGVTGKNRWHVWNEMAHLPLIVHLPEDRYAGERRDQLTQNIDIGPTLLEYFSISSSERIQGESWIPILEEEQPAERKGALYGWFGKTVNISDGQYTYLRAPAGAENEPLFRYFLTPTSFGYHELPGKEFFKEAELGDFLPYTDYPVLRAKVDSTRPDPIKNTLLFNIEEDPEQQNNLKGKDIEEKCIKLLWEVLEKIEAPEEQQERLGLK